MNLIEKSFLLRRAPPFGAVDPSSLALLASRAAVVDVLDGDVVARQEERTDSFYLVVRGEIELIRGDGAARRLGEGGCFGARALLAGADSAVQARALEPGRLLKIARADLLDLLAERPELALALLDGLARRYPDLLH